MGGIMISSSEVFRKTEWVERCQVLGILSGTRHSLWESWRLLCHCCHSPSPEPKTFCPCESPALSPRFSLPSLQPSPWLLTLGSWLLPGSVSTGSGHSLLDTFEPANCRLTFYLGLRSLGGMNGENCHTDMSPLTHELQYLDSKGNVTFSPLSLPFEPPWRGGRMKNLIEEWNPKETALGPERSQKFSIFRAPLWKHKNKNNASCRFSIYLPLMPPPRPRHLL